MDNIKNLAILMATYNGEKYIEEQLNSILNQTYKDFVLYIRDDNSVDNTQKIINKYVKMYPDKIIQVKDDRTAGGAAKNFMCLLEYVYKLNKFDIYMFSDQDDVWLEDKIQVTVEEYNKINNKEQPVLIHTDLNVVDYKINLISKSFIKYIGLKSHYKEFNNYLIQNNVTGCTMLINKSLVELINFNIKNIRMHDWYFALIASAFGNVIFINKSTINYRQHENNVFGVRESKVKISAITKLFKEEKGKKDYKQTFAQAESFKENYYNKLNDTNKNIIDEFLKIKEVNRLNKIKIIIKNKFYKHRKISLIGEFILI